ncbi:MAG: MATE family efflux transporter [Spirochaetaceae bacterium]|nr:MATE family efflux transporter [Spirochaetaceae bacterium]
MRFHFHLPKAHARDMTVGSIPLQIIQFAIPLMLGNMFQMLYNTVDVWVVGQYVGKEALAAVGSTSMITNMAIFFFNGFSIGASVLIGHHFGAKNEELLHHTIETTMATAFILSALFTIVGILSVQPMLVLMKTPSDVMQSATTYLRIYFVGISGLLIYNLGSAILRAVGNTIYPLIFLAITSVLNTVLDLFFVIVLGAGIAGVAYATIISQIISALLVLLMLMNTKEVYRFTWHDIKIKWNILRDIVSIGLPAGIQSIITSLSNIFVQSYINSFGSDCMAGWGCYDKLDHFITLPMQSVSMSTTAFVSQNIGAQQEERSEKGIRFSIALSVGITMSIGAILYVFANMAIGFFTREASVIEYGVMFFRNNVFFLAANCINFILASALRGHGDSKAPMLIMISSFVLIRQCYLFIINTVFTASAALVGFGYPVGWLACLMIEVPYYFFVHKPRVKKYSPVS